MTRSTYPQGAFWTLLGLAITVGLTNEGALAATPSATFVRQEATVDHVKLIDPVSRVVEEKYSCRIGAGMGVCVNKKHIRRPGGAEIRLIFDEPGDKPLTHFLPNTPLVQQPEHSVGQRVCVETMRGSFGIVVALLEPLDESGACAPAPLPYR